MFGERKRILALILIMALVALTVTGFTILSLYHVAFEQQEAMLSGIVKSRARLFESIVHSAINRHQDDPYLALKHAIAQLEDSSEAFPGIGLTGEFTLAKRHDNTITYILRRRWNDQSVPAPIPLNTNLAEPMRQALLGHSGAMVGLDYRGVMVLAAFEPINVGNMGMVAKINLTEVRAPYIRAGLVSLGLALMFIIGGTILFYRVSGPLLSQLQSHARALEKEVEDRTRSEEESQQRRAYVESIFRAAPIGIGVVIDRIIHQANDMFCVMTGYKREEILGQSSRILYPSEEEYAFVGQAKYAQIKDKGVGTVETRWRRKDGTICHVILSSSPLDASDWSRGVTFTAQDITQRKLMEAELEQQQKLLTGLVNNSPSAIAMRDQTGRFVMVNSAYEKMFGISRDEILGKTMAEVYPSNLAEMFEAEDQIVLSSLALQAVEKTYPLPQGTRTFWVSKFPLKDSSGNLLGLCVIDTDITELRRAEVERNRFFTLSVDMLCILSFEGYFKQVNPAWEKNLGWKTEELLKRPILDFIHPDDRQVTLEMRERLKAGEKIIGFENRYQCVDGSYKTFCWNTFPLPGEKLLFGVARDITERKDLEEKLRQAQKMESIGQLAGGIAHDFNNLLSPILGYAELLLETIPKSDRKHDYIADIHTAANRAKELTRQLLAFGRKQLLAMKNLDVNQVIQGFERILRRTLREDVAIAYFLDRAPLTVTADPGQIEQILMNLAINAQDAMPQGGTLTIETSLVFLDEEHAKRHPSILPGPHVLISVSDTGIGMDASTQSKIFDPFFTTKDVGQGTGLGLATVYGIVNQHRGSIWVYSEPGQGTTFKIYLPFTEEPLIESEKQASGPTPTLGGESILVVEDNHMVRDLAVTILKGKGYNVLAAASPEECLELLADKIAQVDLLLTDVVMPGMNGRELHNTLKRTYPKLKVIYMSGYSKNVIAHHGVLDQGVVFLAKPFTVSALSLKVREVLGS